MSELDNEPLVATLLELLNTKPLNFREIVKVSNQLSKKDTKFQRFAIDAKTLIHLGRDSIKDIQQR